MKEHLGERCLQHSDKWQKQDTSIPHSIEELRRFCRQQHTLLEPKIRKYVYTCEWNQAVLFTGNIFHVRTRSRGILLVFSLKITMIWYHRFTVQGKSTTFSCWEASANASVSAGFPHFSLASPGTKNQNIRSNQLWRCSVGSACQRSSVIKYVRPAGSSCVQRSGK